MEEIAGTVSIPLEEIDEHGAAISSTIFSARIAKVSGELEELQLAPDRAVR